jgi:triosephosphate isomerase (TIM)
MSEQIRKPLMAANWKMNITHLEAIAYLNKLSFTLTDKDYDKTEVVLFPAFVALRSVQTIVDADRLPIKFGAQDMSAHENGAFTGEISATMLTKLQTNFVLIGHSERRAYHHETDELVNTKAKLAIKNKLTPMIAIGETLDIRQAGNAVSHTVSQLKAAFKSITPDKAKDVVVAYEPVWAIGTGEVAQDSDAQEMCGEIRIALAKLYSDDIANKIRILYGGSVKPSNVQGLMEQPDIDGALVGGASLDPDDFVKIVRFDQQR